MKIDTKNPNYLDAFEKLKALIISEPILQLPDFEKRFVLTTDASNVPLGAVLSQNGHPISFISRTQNEHELNYSAIEKELLAIVWATKTFRHYLLGRQFEIASNSLITIKHSLIKRKRLIKSQFHRNLAYNYNVTSIIWDGPHPTNSNKQH